MGWTLWNHFTCRAAAAWQKCRRSFSIHWNQKTSPRLPKPSDAMFRIITVSQCKAPRNRYLILIFIYSLSFFREICSRFLLLQCICAYIAILHMFILQHVGFHERLKTKLMNFTLDYDDSFANEYLVVAITDFYSRKILQPNNTCFNQYM